MRWRKKNVKKTKLHKNDDIDDKYRLIEHGFKRKDFTKIPCDIKEKK